MKITDTTDADGKKLRFQFTGSLLRSSFYLPRAADEELYDKLIQGHYCDVLAPRQIGKSSLRVKVAQRLEANGVKVASVDLTSVGTAASPEEWYFGLVDMVAGKLNLDDPIDFWEERREESPALRWSRYLREVVLKQIPGRVVLIFDEIEAVRLVEFSMDDFLMSIRALFEARAEDDALRRLSFCLVGVTYPSDLVENKLITPFNISLHVRLDDFTRVELGGLAPGLANVGGETAALLDAIHHWTGGHPYMTMRAAAALAEWADDNGPMQHGQESETVDAMVRKEFLTHPLEDPNLNYAARRFDHDRPGVSLTDKIGMYRKLLVQERVPALAEHQVQLELYLAGMVRQVEEADGQRVLALRNGIYARVFDRQWLRGKERLQFLATAVWQWLDSGKKDTSTLLRGEALSKAMEWSRSRVLNKDEEEFLRVSSHAERRSAAAEAAQVRAVTEAEKKRAEAEAAKTRALSEAERKQAEVEAKRVQELAAQGKRNAVRVFVFSVASAIIALGGTLMLLNYKVTEANRDKEKAEKATATAELAKASIEKKNREALHKLEEKTKLLEEVQLVQAEQEQNSKKLMAEASKKIADANAKIAEAEKTRKWSEAAAKQAQEERDKVRKARRAEQRRLKQLEEKNAQLLRDKMKTEVELAKKRAELADWTSGKTPRLKALGIQLKRVDSELKECKAGVTRLEDQNKICQGRVKKAENQAARLTVEKNRFKWTVNSLKRDKKRLEGELEALRPKSEAKGQSEKTK